MKTYLIIAMVIFGALLIVGSLLIETFSSSHTEKVDCYDSNGNRIDGLVCYEKILDYQYIPSVYLLFSIKSLGLIFMAIGIVKTIENISFVEVDS